MATNHGQLSGQKSILQISLFYHPIFLSTIIAPDSWASLTQEQS
jgi:hypothetical protein